MLRAVGQLAGLAVAVLLLIALPAHLRGRLAQRPAQAAAACLLYLAFFGGGTVLLRTLRHGRLAPRKSDAQRARGSSRLALLLFAGVAVPAGHFGAWWDPSLALLPAAAGGVLQRALPPLGYALMLAATALNFAAAAALGKAFDRLVQPEALVTSGPYALMQHPIYTSYMGLFSGHCLSLGSPAAAAFLLAACLWHYARRTALEEGLLESAFGEEYRRYQAHTGRFLPRLPCQT
ncbi:hypothetical protein ABPG75_003358 [Micractinium tetrahymenae]